MSNRVLYYVSTLNDIAGLENPTCEILARWIAYALAPGVKPARVSMVSVGETETCGATLRLDPAQ